MNLAPEYSFDSSRSYVEIWLQEKAFKNFHGPGFYFEAGAADGISGSPTFFLDRYAGWRGILVEPNPKFHKRAAKIRSGMLLRACLSSKNAYAEFVAAGWFGRVAAEVTGDDLFKKDFDGSEAQTVRVPALTLETVLDICAAPEEIEFVSLDLEGHEPEVLRAFPFDKYRLRCLCVETKYRGPKTLPDGKGEPVYSASGLNVVTKLEAEGYVRDTEWARAYNIVDDLFIHQDYAASTL